MRAKYRIKTWDGRWSVTAPLREVAPGQWGIEGKTLDTHAECVQWMLADSIEQYTHWYDTHTASEPVR